MLEVKNLAFKYDNNQVLSEINHTFKPSHIYGVIGANGAGKSTLLKCLANFHYPNEGDISFEGKDIINNHDYLKKSFFLDNDYYFDNHTTMSLLKLYANLKGVVVDYGKFYELVEKLDFNYLRRIRNLSRGNQKIANIIIALSLKIEVLILDEFLDNIDLVNRRFLKDALVAKCLDEKIIIILASHTISDISDICDQIVLLSNDRIIKASDIDTLRESYLTYQIVFDDKKIGLSDLKEKGIEALNYREFENIRWFTIENTPSQVELVNELKVIDLRVVKTNIEEVFYNEFIRK